MRAAPRLLLTASLAVSVVGPLAGCRTIPGTGRSQVNVMPESQMEAMSAQAFADVKKQKLSADVAKNECLKRVGSRIVAEARKVDPSLPAFAQWEFVVVQDESANAFAMSGGKVAFHTGIFKLMKSDDEVAVVMGHEVAHVICRHGNERVSQSLLSQGVLMGTSAVMKDTKYKPYIMGGLGLGAQYGVMLPFSRTHESEADILGIKLSSRAGYDPQVAIGFWEKMSAGGASQPEFLSTHPSGSTRIQDLRKEMPGASAEYQRARAAGQPAGLKW
jgi:predicted Zn-dependent protease